MTFVRDHQYSLFVIAIPPSGKYFAVKAVNPATKMETVIVMKHVKTNGPHFGVLSINSNAEKKEYKEIVAKHVISALDLL